MSADEHLSPDQFETLYHLTNKRQFKPSATKVPEDNALSIQERTRPGLFAAPNVESWWNGHGYHRPYVAEIQVPKGLAQEERWGGERFIPGEHLAQAHVSRVIPVDAYVRERFHEPGWVEDHHGTKFDTGEPIKRGPWGMPERGTIPADYHYEGPDVRDFSPQQHQEHVRRLRAYEKGQGQ